MGDPAKIAQAHPMGAGMSMFQPNTRNKVARLERKAARGNMRAMQKLDTMEAFKKKREEDDKDEPLSPAEMQAAAAVSQGVGDAAGQALLQGQMPGQTYDAAAIGAGVSSGADIAAQQNKDILDTILKVKEGQRLAQSAVIERGGESQWRQNMAEVELALKAGMSGAAAV